MVAGGRSAVQTSGKSENDCTPQGCQTFGAFVCLSPGIPPGCAIISRVSGGLRCAPTSGYRLATLRVGHKDEPLAGSFSFPDSDFLRISDFIASYGSYTRATGADFALLDPLDGRTN